MNLTWIFGLVLATFYYSFQVIARIKKKRFWSVSLLKKVHTNTCSLGLNERVDSSYVVVMLIFYSYRISSGFSLCSADVSPENWRRGHLQDNAFLKQLDKAGSAKNNKNILTFHFEFKAKVLSAWPPAKMGSLMFCLETKYFFVDKTGAF